MIHSIRTSDYKSVATACERKSGEKKTKSWRRRLDCTMKAYVWNQKKFGNRYVSFTAHRNLPITPAQQVLGLSKSIKIKLFFMDKNWNYYLSRGKKNRSWKQPANHYWDSICVSATFKSQQLCKLSEVEGAGLARSWWKGYTERCKQCKL